jgi:hypothetical protein
MTSLASIVGPLATSSLYFAYRASFPGLVWIAGAALYLISVPLLIGLPARTQLAARAQAWEAPANSRAPDTDGTIPRVNHEFLAAAVHFAVHA